MNIKGAILLKELGLPEGYTHFKELIEVPQEIMDSLKSGKSLFIMGSDKRISINDHPYKIKKWRRVQISKQELSSSYEKINLEMKEDGIPKNERIFSLGHCFTDTNVKLQGHALRTKDKIFIDAKTTHRGYGSDFTPELSFEIPLANKRILFSKIPDSKFREEIVQICKDILELPGGNPYLDFVILKEEGLKYHDLSIH